MTRSFPSKIWQSMVANCSDPDHLVCRILGNEQNNPSGRYQPLWYQARLNQNYFQEKSIHTSHIMRTTMNNLLSNITLTPTEKWHLLSEANLSLVSSAQVFYRTDAIRNARLLLTVDAQDALLKNVYVFENWGREQLEADRAASKAIKRKR